MKKLLIILSCLCLTACATMPAKQGAHNRKMSWQARQQQLQPIQQWHLTGAIGIIMPQQGQSASITWAQQQRNYQIALFGPLGVGRTSLTGTPEQVTLLANGKRYTAKTAEQLMQQQLGWQLPVSNLYYWVRGLPAINIPDKISFDAYHHITTLQQQGWTIHYQRYTGVGNLDLPSKLELVHGQLRVKLVISSWNLSHN